MADPVAKLATETYGTDEHELRTFVMVLASGLAGGLLTKGTAHHMYFDHTHLNVTTAHAQ